MNNNSRRRGFSFLSFFLGILMGMILLAGIVCGTAYIALSCKVDDVFNLIGMPNKDENGDNIYINSDKENGGVETLLELVTVLGEYAQATDTLSVGKVENLLPAVRGFVDELHGTINEFIPIEREELAAVQFAQLGDFMRDKVMDVKPAALFTQFGMSDVLENPIMKLIFLGTEANYVTVGGVKSPVYYDLYVNGESGFVRKADNAPVNENHAQYLVENGEEYRLHYYRNDGGCTVTDGEFNPVTAVAKYVPSSEAKMTGNYYYDGETRVETNPITLRTLSENGFDALNDVYLTELIGSESGDLADKVLGGISLGDIMNGNVDLQGVLDNLGINEFLDVKPTEPIIAYLAYGIYEINLGDKSCLAGDGINCTYTVDTFGVIEKVTAHDGTEIKGTSISNINDRIQGITQKLKIKDLMDVSGNAVLEKLGDCTISGVGEGINSLTVGDVVTDAENNFLLKHLSDTCIKDMPAKLATLSVNVLYANEIYGKDAPVSATAGNFNPDYLYYEKDESGEFVLVNGDGKLAAYRAGTYTYGAATGIWKTLLYKDGTEAAYTLDNLGAMIGNVSANISTATLSELKANGIVTSFNDEDLNMRLPDSDKTLGDLTVSQALTELADIIRKYQQITGGGSY